MRPTLACPTGRCIVAKAQDVESYMETLEYPLIDGVEALREIIPAIDSRIVESIKWNAPSYAIGDHFATLNLHRQDSIQVVLHGGAKPRADLGSLRIDDPSGMLSWAAPDRANVEFASVEDISARRLEFEAILRQWIAQVVDGERPAG